MELIKITEQNGQRVVSARELHSFLESKKQFADWIKHRIKKYDLVENQDFVLASPNGEGKHGGHNALEYALTLDAAKELAMVEGNAKGKQARQYFIECERQVKSGAIKLPTPKELAQMLIQAEEEKERLQAITELQAKELSEAAPKVEYHDQVLSSQSTYNTNLIAKEMGLSAITLNQLLSDLKVQYKQNGTWLLYHKYQNQGYTKTRTYSYTAADGSTKTAMQTVWTESGRKFIHDITKNTPTLLLKKTA